MHSLYLRKMPGRTLKVYVEDKSSVKYLTAHFEACYPVTIYGRSMHVCRMLWVHTNVRIGIVRVGMPACFALPFVHQSVASARLSVRLMILYHWSSFYLPSVHLTDFPSVRLYVCLCVCSHVPM